MRRAVPPSLVFTSILSLALFACGGPEPTPPVAGQTSPLPEPDLSRLEPIVREQLTRQRARLAELERGQAPPGELGEGFGRLGMLYHAYAFLPAARACYEQAEHRAPRELRWPFYRGHLELARGANGEAAAAFTRALALSPRDVPAWIGLGRAEQAGGHAEAAEAAFERALALDAGALVARYGRAQLAAERGALGLAIEELEAILKVAPGAEPVQRSLAALYARAGDRARAEEMARRGGTLPIPFADPLLSALEELKMSGRAMVDRGVAAFTEGRFADAEAAFREALKSLPEDADAHLNLGSALFQLGRAAEAEAEYLRTLELEPTNARALFNLGVLLAARGEREAAMDHYELALAADPSHLGARFNLANAELALGHFAACEASFAASVGADPRNAAARVGLAVCLSRQGKDRAARAGLEEGLRQQPGERSQTFALARLLAASPDDAVRSGDQALALAQSLIRTTSELRDIETLSMAYAEAGKLKEAATTAEQALAAIRQSPHPELAPATEALLRLYRAGRPCRTPFRGYEFGGAW